MDWSGRHSRVLVEVYGVLSLTEDGEGCRNVGGVDTAHEARPSHSTCSGVWSVLFGPSPLLHIQLG